MTKAEEDVDPVAVVFAYELRDACERAADAGLPGDDLVEILVEAVAVIIAKAFIDDRPAAKRLAREYGTMLRESTGMFLDEIGGRLH